MRLACLSGWVGGWVKRRREEGEGGGWVGVLALPYLGEFVGVGCLEELGCELHQPFGVHGHDVAHVFSVGG